MLLVVDPLSIAGLALGGAGLLSGLFGSKEQSRNVRDTNSMNLQIARETNQTQKELAAQNQRNQLALMRENNEWSAQQAEHMFNLENAYNDPAAQRERLSNAGFNPAVAMSNGAVGASMGDIATPSAAGSTFTPAMPNFVTPTMQAPPSVMLGMQDAIANLANGFNTYQSARMTEKQISRYDENLDAQINHLSSQASLADSKKQYQDVLTGLEKTFGHGDRMRKIARDFREIYLLGLKGETEKANRELTDWNAKIAKQTHGRNDQEIPFIIAAAEESVKLIQEKQKTEKSQQSANYASSEASKASANASIASAKLTEEQRQRLVDTHDDFVQMSHFARRNQQIDYTKAAATMQDYIEQMHNANLISSQTYKKIKSEIDILEKDKKWYNFDKVLNSIERVNNGVNKWAPWALSRDEVSPQNGMMFQSWQSNGTY